MPNIPLSQNADKALNLIYKKYLSCKSNATSSSYLSTAFEVDSIFSDQNDDNLISTIIELNQNEFIWFFSDRRIMLKNKGIAYIENKLAKGLTLPNDFGT